VRSRFWRHIAFHDLDDRLRHKGGEIVRGGANVVVAHGARRLDHELEGSLRHGEFPRAAFEIGDLLHDVLGGQPGEARAFRPPGSLRAMAGAASAHPGRNPMGDHFRHWRMIGGMPVGRKEEILLLSDREARAALWNVARKIVCGRQWEVGSPKIGPGRQILRLPRRFRGFAINEGAC